MLTRRRKNGGDFRKRNRSYGLSDQIRKRKGEMK